MLILNHKGDALFDTTNAIIRIAYSETSKKYVVLGINNGYGSIVLSSHDSKEEAQKILTMLHYAAGIGLKIWNLDGDFSDLDDIIGRLRDVMQCKVQKLL
jgi:hypothetical protein